MPFCPNPTCSCSHNNLTVSQYQEHMRTAPWAARFCPSCRSVCGSVQALLKHNRNVHGMTGALPSQPSTPAAAAALPAPSPRPASTGLVYPSNVKADRYCALCRREYASTAALKHHYRDHKGHPKCGPCNEGFLNDAALNAHKTTAHSTRPIPTMASVLSVASSSSSSSASSIFPKPQVPSASTSIVPQYKFACTLCNIPFAHQDHLSDHYRKSLVHPQCDRCGIGARDSSTLAAHTRLVHQTATCTFCPGVRMLEEEVDAHRADKGHSMCASCNHDFQSREDLSAHVALIHPSFRCAQCDTPYSSATVLEQHYLDSPAHMKCSKCPDVGFPDRLSWEAHVRTNHSDLWCARCNECFSTGSGLENHFQTSMVHPKCYDCGLGFIDDAALQEHVIAVSTVLLRVSTLILSLSLKINEEESDIESIASPSTEATEFTAPPVIITLSPRSSPGTRPVPLSPYVQANEDEQPFADVDDDIKYAASDEPVQPIEESNPNRPDIVVDETVVVFQVHVDVHADTPTRPKSADGARPSLTPQFISAPAIPTLIDASAEPALKDSDNHNSPLAEVSQIADLRPADVPETDRSSLPRATPPPSEDHLHMTGASLSIPLVDSPSVYLSDDSASITSRAETVATIAISSKSARPMKLEVLTSPSSVRSSGTAVMSPSSLLDAPPGQRAGSALSGARSRASGRTPSRLHEASREASRSPYQHDLDVPDVQFEPTGFQGTFGVQRSRTPSVAYSSHPQPVRGPSPRGSRAPSPNVRHIPWTSAHDNEYHAERQEDTHRVSYIYCRLCRRDPARQPTATMCGHIYCHSCIVDEVVKSSKCPACTAPTLLYSLIKLQVL